MRLLVSSATATRHCQNSVKSVIKIRTFAEYSAGRCSTGKFSATEFRHRSVSDGALREKRYPKIVETRGVLYRRSGLVLKDWGTKVIEQNCPHKGHEEILHGVGGVYHLPQQLPECGH